MVLKYSNKKLHKEKRQLIKERRLHLKEGKEEEYGRIVREIVKKEEIVFSSLLGLLMEELQVSELVSTTTLKTYISSPQAYSSIK